MAQDKMVKLRVLIFGLVVGCLKEVVVLYCTVGTRSSTEKPRSINLTGIAPGCTAVVSSYYEYSHSHLYIELLLFS